MSDMRPILIFGPTASGKSAVALALAEKLGGLIVNADSMQVYRELRILTARPSPEDEARAPHALYGFVPGQESYSAGRYAADVARVLAAAKDEGRRPIVVGGTGLYFKTLVEGLSPIPAVPDDVRSYWRARGTEQGAGALHAVLAARDPQMAARLAPSDTQRIVRALEVIDATGASLADWQRVPREPVLPLDESIPLRVAINRDELYRRIDQRFAAMIESGAIDEVLQLERLGIDAAAPIMAALGVRPLLRHLAGKLTREEAVEAAQAETRQYAKRQETWARSNMITWNAVLSQQMKNIGAFIEFFVQKAH